MLNQQIGKGFCSNPEFKVTPETEAPPRFACSEGNQRLSVKFCELHDTRHHLSSFSENRIEMKATYFLRSASDPGQPSTPITTNESPAVEDSPDQSSSAPCQQRKIRTQDLRPLPRPSPLASLSTSVEADNTG
eukprot:CAMPEP_0113662690 /NCGR_PEP_ID=MMETSP0038_2-20120614/717_1 /TAXON_ID=2898 /ORGANISM="Cryptomonas paramecium" /LENGTH=132 /DNA_ID=CAMNT_0000577615 /DNA_START=96 /DNA_END=494 /DNA_ORIENTATION=+ /assembly_acc=CAM_ASM_000170